jgi:predicted transcriptional regulator
MAAAKKNQKQSPEPTWTFLTNHGHVLVCIAQNPDIRITEIAGLVGIGERAAHRIVSDLAVGGYVLVRKDGRRNTYSVDFSRHLRHPLESDHTIGEIFRSLSRLRRG